MGTSAAAGRHIEHVPLAVLLIVVLPALAAAQEPVKSFDQLNTRLKVGDTVWVTDAQGREVKGRISALAPSSVTLGDGEERTLRADDVRVIQLRQHDSLWNGTLIGLAVGLGIGIAQGASCSEGGDWCGGGTTIGYPIAGAVFGTGI